MRIVLIIAFLVTCQSSFGQADFLILKKKNHIVKKYYPGNQLDVSTPTGTYTGVIRDIARDSVFMVYYDVKRMQTTIGTVVLDTIRTYYFGIPYSQITTILEKRTGWDWQSSGAALFGGGTVLTTAGLLTWVFAKKDTRYYASKELVGGAAALAVIGYFLLKTGDKNIHIGKKYRLEYIKLKED